MTNVQNKSVHSEAEALSFLVRATRVELGHVDSLLHTSLQVESEIVRQQPGMDRDSHVWNVFADKAETTADVALALFLVETAPYTYDALQAQIVDLEARTSRTYQRDFLEMRGRKTDGCEYVPRPRVWRQRFLVDLIRHNIKAPNRPAISDAAVERVLQAFEAMDLIVRSPRGDSSIEGLDVQVRKGLLEAVCNATTSAAAPNSESKGFLSSLRPAAVSVAALVCCLFVSLPEAARADVGSNFAYQTVESAPRVFEMAQGEYFRSETQFEFASASDVMGGFKHLLEGTGPTQLPMGLAKTAHIRQARQLELTARAEAQEAGLERLDLASASDVLGGFKHLLDGTGPKQGIVASFQPMSSVTTVVWN